MTPRGRLDRNPRKPLGSHRKEGRHQESPLKMRSENWAAGRLQENIWFIFLCSGVSVSIDGAICNRLTLMLPSDIVGLGRVLDGWLRSLVSTPSLLLRNKGGTCGWQSSPLDVSVIMLLCDF